MKHAFEREYIMPTEFWGMNFWDKYIASLYGK